MSAAFALARVVFGSVNSARSAAAFVSGLESLPHPDKPLHRAGEAKGGWRAEGGGKETLGRKERRSVFVRGEGGRRERESASRMEDSEGRKG